MKINKKHKKTYLLIIFVSIIYFTLIACIINDCRQITQDYVAKYKLHIEKISNLEDDPLALAEEFMQTKYDKHWKSLGCYGEFDAWRGNIDYELAAKIVPGKSATSFKRYNIDDYERDRFPEDMNMRIACSAYVNDKSENDVKTVEVVFTYGNSIQNVTVYVDYHGENPAESVHFNISLIENEYVADRINAEELTGLTIEEMVETAELNRKGFEDLMYAMKEHELEESKKDLNSNLESLYAIAALLVVILLILWITVLAAIIKPKSGNKKQVLFRSKHDIDREIKSKNMRAYLLAMLISIIHITLIAGIIGLCRLTAENHVNEYNLHIEEVKNLEDDPLVLAEEFMRTAYDKHWNSLKGCHGSHDEYETENDYELSTHILLGSPPTVFTRYNRLGSNDSIWNTVPADKDFLIKCEAYADNTTEYDKNITIAFDYSENITYLTVCVEYYGNNQADPEYFIINLTQNGADAGTVNVEELTGLTIEEIVETAELNRKGFEDLMYAMKEHELEESENDLNSVLRRSYIITALHVVMFIGIWIYVLTAILKSIPSNKNRRTF